MTTTRPIVKCALAALAALAIQACSSDPTGPSRPGNRGVVRDVREGGDRAAAAEELQANRERWEAAGVEDYRYVLRRMCDCDAETVLVEVRGGEAVSVTPLEGERERLTWAVDSLDNFRRLFGRVRSEMESGPDGLKAAYDPEWGYPVYLHVDPRWDVAGDERGFRVEKFEPMR